MSFYIRKGNLVLREIDLVIGPKWSEITDKTSRICICAFTTRKDAQEFVRDELSTEVVEIVNNLDYKH